MKTLLLVIVWALLFFCLCVFFMAIAQSITEEELYKQIENNKKNGKEKTDERSTTKEN